MCTSYAPIKTDNKKVDGAVHTTLTPTLTSFNFLPFSVSTCVSTLCWSLVLCWFVCLPMSVPLSRVYFLVLVCSPSDWFGPCFCLTIQFSWILLIAFLLLNFLDFGIWLLALNVDFSACPFLRLTWKTTTIMSSAAKQSLWDYFEAIWSMITLGAYQNPSELRGCLFHNLSNASMLQFTHVKMCMLHSRTLNPYPSGFLFVLKCELAATINRT